MQVIANVHVGVDQVNQDLSCLGGTIYDRWAVLGRQLSYRLNSATGEQQGSPLICVLSQLKAQG